MNTVEIVQSIYEAFGRGDVPGIMAHLSPEIEWDTEQRGAAAEVPWLRPRRGHAEVAGFFADLAAHVDLQRFEPRNLYAAPDGSVIGQFFLDGLVRKTQRHVIDPADMHLWQFDARGKVVRFRHVVDTWQHVSAWQG